MSYGSGMQPRRGDAPHASGAASARENSARPDGASSRGRKRIAIALAGAFALLLAVAAASAWTTLGMTFPSFFLNPYGEFSTVHLPGWPTPSALRNPDRIVAIDGRPMPPTDAAGVSGAAYRALSALDPAAREATFTFDGDAGTRSVTVALGRIGGAELWVFFLLYAATGALVVASAVVVVLISERPMARAVYAIWAASMAGFLITFYDWHTAAWLHAVFTVSTVGMVLSPVLLALSFPGPLLRARGAWRAAGVLLTAAAAAAAAWALLAAAAGIDPLGLRRLVALLLVPSLSVFVAVALARLHASRAQERAQLRFAFLGLVAVPLVGAGAATVLRLTGVDLLHLALPGVAASFPLSIGYALVRSNILGAQAIARRRMLVAPAATVALFGATVLWVLVQRVLGPRVTRSELAAGLAVATFFILIAGTWRLGRALLFPATQRFQPTMELLGDRLSASREAAAVRRTLEEVTRIWLPTCAARVVAPAALDERELGAGAWERLRAGERAWTRGDAWERDLLVPMRSLGALRAVLRVAPKQDFALFTEQELALLETVASLGAIALHNAEVLDEVEGLRRIELSAAHDEKRLALGLLGAELSHELAYPLNFLRFLLQQAGRKARLSDEDLEIGQEEVERLARMLATLRRFSVPTPRMEAVRIMPSLRRALHLSRDLITEKQIHVLVEVPEELSVLAEADPLVQLFSNLIRNAAQAVPAGGDVGVRHVQGPEEAIEVWDTGPGIPEPLRSSIFSPWITTREGGSGLGLAVALRIVRAFGWRISVDSAPGSTTFRVGIHAERAPPMETQGVRGVA